jgi:hypothetical protein
MIPKPVPKSFGLTNMGIVGTIMVQNIAMHMPSKKQGIHLTHSVYLSNIFASRNIMKR